MRGPYLCDVQQARIFRVGIQAQQDRVEHDAQHNRCLEHVRPDQRPRLFPRFRVGQAGPGRSKWAGRGVEAHMGRQCGGRAGFGFAAVKPHRPTLLYFRGWGVHCECLDPLGNLSPLLQNKPLKHCFMHRYTQGAPTVSRRSVLPSDRAAPGVFDVPSCPTNSKGVTWNRFCCGILIGVAASLRSPPSECQN